ncbi:Rne/Rng family ribonuclease [Alkaliphilus transvaalensis]|uniref:Rne/Rng family ribonuclease n=1 Tax=Alkaliphilus transvaalensis TaxID=114628 RepID=UPI00047944A2|nr:Rne/Rng family ribonuclease [Alkaliphilus transvaalensis]
MNQIVVDVGIVETRLALLEDHELVELYIERKNQKRIVGNIYKGRVTNVLPGMQAAFVDIGLEKNSFLYVKDAIPEDLLNNEESCKDISIKELLKPGQEIIVQVIKEPIGSKGARVTTHITLPGRYLVLMPNTDYVGISRRIGSEEERERLKTEIEELKPGKMGVIVRTVASGKTKEDFRDDIKFLLKLWQKIEKDKKLGFAPRLIYKDFDLINRTIRDVFNKEIDQFIINDREEYQSARDLVELISPLLKDKLRLEEDEDIFQTYKIDGQINKAISRKIWLKSGGYIVIDTTEALTVVDVNTGKYVGSIDLDDTVFKTNLEAATEIAKQLRLRDIGGIIIVDFIDMINEKYDEEVLMVLEKALGKDRTKTKILGMTQLGLVEITRKKVRQRLDFLLQRRCDCCEGTGKVLSEYTLLHKLEIHLKRMREHTTCQAVLFEVNPVALEVIKGEQELLEEMERVTQIKVFFQIDEKLAYHEINRKVMGNIDMIEKLLKEKSSERVDNS